MKYMYWTFLSFLIVIGLVVSIYFGLQPKPVPKIKPSQVESAEHFGAAISKRLWEEIKEAQLLFLGVDSESADDMLVWKGFLEGLTEDSLKYSLVIVEPALTHKNLLSHNDEIDINQESARFADNLKTVLANHQRVAVIVPTIYSSQAIPENPVNRLKMQIQNPVMSISVVSPTLHREDEEKTPFPCVTGSGDTRGLGSFGCLIRGKSRGLYMKNWVSGKYLGLMDQIGERDYLVLFRRVP